MQRLTFLRSLLVFAIAFSAVLTAQAQTNDEPETVLVTYHPKSGQEEQFLAKIARLKACGGKVGKTIKEQKNYFANQAKRMNYQENAKRGWPIGSGSAESACGGKQGRFKRRGQFWTHSGVRSLEALIEARENHHWDELWFAA